MNSFKCAKEKKLILGLVNHMHVKCVKKVGSAIKLCSYYFSRYVSTLMSLEFFKVDTLNKNIKCFVTK